jgi:O-acetyl-ADP-ribose deacetylase
MKKEMIEIVKGDITCVDVDCIVNAANSRLLRGGGVCGSIHRAAGEALAKYLQEHYDGCPTGESRISPGFNCLSKYIIHTVAPIWEGGDFDEPNLLQSCYEQTLQLATAHQIQSIGFPALGCGVYCYPIEAAAKIAFETARKHLLHNDIRIVFCCFDESVWKVYQSIFGQHRKNISKESLTNVEKP